MSKKNWKNHENNCATPSQNNKNKFGTKTVIRPRKKMQVQSTLNDFFTTKIKNNEIDYSILNDNFPNNDNQINSLSMIEEPNFNNEINGNNNINIENDINFKKKKIEE